MHQTSQDLFNSGDFLTKLDTYQDYSKTLESAKEKLKNDIRFGK